MAPLAQYLADPNSGLTIVRPVFPTFSFSFKLAEDFSAQRTPRLLLRAMQQAVHDPSAAPVYPSDLALSQQFDQTSVAAQQAERRGNPC